MADVALSTTIRVAGPHVHLVTRPVQLSAPGSSRAFPARVSSRPPTRRSVSEWPSAPPDRGRSRVVTEMTEPFLVTVELRGLSVRRMVPPVPVADLDRVEPVVKALIAEIAAERGLWPDQVAVMLASQLVLDEADDAAYRRVCERKGLLPL